MGLILFMLISVLKSLQTVVSILLNTSFWTTVSTLYASFITDHWSLL